MKKHVKLFTDTKINLDGNTKEINGGKGYNLIKMKSEGYPVPNGMVITTVACNQYRNLVSPKAKENHLNKIMVTVMKYLPYITKDSKTDMVSIRSGAAVSMPGMMDTILNVGSGYVTSSKNTKFLKDCKKRFTDMFLDVVMGVDRGDYKEHLDTKTEELFELIKSNYPLYYDVIKASIRAVFDSWDNDRAVHYRNMHGINHDMGSAVVIQSMVFGNLNNKSGSGVMFTRNPNTGVQLPMGEFLINAQGEDVVAGTATPLPLQQMAGWNNKMYAQLSSIGSDLEWANKDMQDIEFTVENGKLFILQTRSGKRSAKAEVKIALDLLKDGAIESLSERINTGSIAKLVEPVLPEDFNLPVTATGIGSGGFFVAGKICTSVDAVLACKEPAILVAEETTPDDIKGMDKAVGILTTKGGATSHAAVVARAMNKPCVVGCGDLDIEDMWKKYTHVLIDGQTGKAYCSDNDIIVNTSVTYPYTLVKELLEGLDTSEYTIALESMEEAVEFQDYLYKVSLPTDSLQGLEESTVISDLAGTFDVVILNSHDMDHGVTSLLGNPDKNDINITKVLDASELYSNVFIEGHNSPSSALGNFETMANVLDQDFYGIVTNQFIETVMGDKQTFDAVVEQVGMGNRVIDVEDLASVIELQLNIG